MFMDDVDKIFSDHLKNHGSADPIPEGFIGYINSGKTVIDDFINGKFEFNYDTENRNG
jgi:hypothetical protein